MKSPTTTLLITRFPKEIKNAILSNPEAYFIHLGNLCGTVTRFKLPKPDVMFITMLSIPEAEKLKELLKGLKRKPGFENLEFKNVDQRLKNYQVVTLVGDNPASPLSDEYKNIEKKENVASVSSIQTNNNSNQINKSNENTSTFYIKKNEQNLEISNHENKLNSNTNNSTKDNSSISKSDNSSSESDNESVTSNQDSNSKLSNEIENSESDSDSESESDSSDSNSSNSSDTESTDTNSSDTDSSDTDSSDTDSADTESSKSITRSKHSFNNNLNEKYSVWDFVNIDKIESFVRWKSDGVWFFVLKFEEDPKHEMDIWNDKLYQTFGNETNLKFIHAKCPLPSENESPEGYTGRFDRIFIGHLTIGLEEQCIRSHFSSFGEIKHVQIPKKSNGRTKGIAFVDYYDNLPIKLALLKNNMYYSESTIVVKEATEPRRSSQDDNGKLFMQGISVVEAASESREFSKKQNKNNQNDNNEEYVNNQNNDEENDIDDIEEYKQKWGKKKTNEIEDEVDPFQVFVCNVAFEAPPRKLKKFFKKAGEIAEFRPVMNDSEFSGKAFIRYEKEEDAKTALSWNKMEFMGRNITVREVRVASKKRKRDDNWEKNKRIKNNY